MSRHFVRMSKFGRMGRFGNQLFQYAFVRAAADKWDAQAELPDWLGQLLFGLPRHQMTGKPAKKLSEKDEHAHPDDFRIGFETDVRGCDVSGYFQYHTKHFAPYRAQWRDWFKPTQQILARLGAPARRLKDKGTVIGIHLRRGDYGRRAFYITPVAWYIHWLHANWGRFDNPQLFVATEDLALLGDFKQWRPHTVPSLGISLRGARFPNHAYLPYDLKNPKPHLFDFYPDFYLLSQCDVLLIPNSTFSFAAAMLGTPRECWRSSLKTAQFDRFDPWNDQPLQYELVENYPHLEGVALASNPQW